MLLTITNEQKIAVSLAPKTAAGNAATLDGIPTWEVVDGDSTVEASADGLSATLRSSDAAGVTNIKVSADADLGEGVQTIEEVITLTVVPASANTLGVVASEPELK